MESGTAHLLQHVGLHLEASTVAWCPVNGLLAVGGRISNDLACVHLIHVHCASRKVSLYVPLQGRASCVLEPQVVWSSPTLGVVLLLYADVTNEQARHLNTALRVLQAPQMVLQACPGLQQAPDVCYSQPR